jgi:YjbR
MVSTGRAKQLALELPEAQEADHHGRPSFRVSDRIFATLWAERHLNVMVDEAGIIGAVQRWPGACEEVWWGKQLRAVKVDLDHADATMLAELLADSWEGRDC